MSRRARLFGGALSLLALLVLVAAGFASASSPPGTPITGTKSGKITKIGQSTPNAPTAARPVHAIGYRLTAKLAPTGNAPTQATGQWDGVLVHTVGVVRNGQMPSVPGCTVTGPRPGGPGQAPPRQQGIPHKIQCNGQGAVPPFTVPASGNHWILGWKLTFANLSSAVTSADIHVTVAAGAAPIAAANLCSGTCVSGKFGRTVLTDDQANAVLAGNGTVVVNTATNQSELSGKIVRMQQTGALHTITK